MLQADVAVMPAKRRDKLRDILETEPRSRQPHLVVIFRVAQRPLENELVAIKSNNNGGVVAWRRLLQAQMAICARCCAMLAMPAINAVMAGCKPEYLPWVIAVIEAICTDEFNIHGVLATTMPTRLAELPNVATMAEQGYPGIGTNAWQALFAPVATPKPIVDKLYAAVVVVLSRPEMKEMLAKQLMTVAVSTSPQEFTDQVRAETQSWSEFVRDNKIKIE